jgi:hypothetical protein
MSTHAKHRLALLAERLPGIGAGTAPVRGTVKVRSSQLRRPSDEDRNSIVPV